jgi:predicted ATPase
MTGSVAASVGRDPETVTERVNEVLEAMAEAVLDGGGIVNRYLGDGMLALFGARDARESDPTKAVEAAKRICRRVAALGGAATAGINTGPVYIGRVGSERHSEVTAMGPVVNLAARLQGKAGPGEVLVSAETARLVGGAFELEERSLTVKGIDQPVHAYAVLADVARPERRVGVRRSRLIGRDREVARLRRAIEELAGARGSVIAVVGEAGLGKSRLVSEALNEVPGAALVLEGRCIESGAAPYHPFRDALQQHDFDLELLDGLARTAIAVAIRGDADYSDARWDELPPAQRQRETRRALVAVIQAVSARPVILVLEDLHWADPPSIAATADLFDVAGRQPLLVLCTYRPWREHPCWTLAAEATQRYPSGADMLALRELTAESCQQIAASLLETDELPLDLGPLILERAQGNPLFIEEFVRSAVETGCVQRDGGNWVVADEAFADRVPDTLELLVRARTDRLTADTRRVLQLAAVQGRVFSTEVLATVDDPVVVASALDELERLDLVQPSRTRSPGELTFKHVLIQQTIEQGILRRTKRSLNGRVLEALETLGTASAAQLAHHAEAAGDASHAVKHLRAAALEAQSAYANEDAVDLFSRASKWSADAGTDDALVAELAEHRGDVLAVMAQHDQARDAFAEARTATRSQDVVGRARLWRKTASVHVVQRAYDEALTAFEHAEAELDESRSADHLAQHEWIDIQLARGLLHYWRNEPEAIGVALDAVRNMVASQGTALQRAEAPQLALMQLMRMNRYRIDQEALHLAQQSASIALEIADPAQRAFKRFNLGFCELWARQLDACLASFDRAIEDAARAGDVVVLSRCHTYRSVAYRFALEDASCAESIGAAEAASGTGGMAEYIGAAHGNRAWLARRRRDWDDARRHANRAIDTWLGLEIVYGFQWIARFPLLAVALDEGDERTAAEQVDRMLRDDQQRLPDNVEVPLLAGDFRRAVNVATALGYA